MRLVPVTVLALACSDYNLSSPVGKDGEGDGDTAFDPGDDTEDYGACGNADKDPREVALAEDCEVEAITGTFTPELKWQQTQPGDTYTTPVVGQLTDDNGNGMLDGGDTPDIVVSNVNGVTWALSGADGAVIWQGGSLGAEPMTPAIGDLDGDGWNEVVGAGASATLALDGRTGKQKWKIGAYAGGHTPQCGAVGIYDLDGDGAAEVVIGRDIYEGASGAVAGRGAYGDGAGHEWAAPMGVAADIDRDGNLDVVVGNALYDKRGNAKWYNNKSDGFVAVGDFDGDKYGEIVVTSMGDMRLQDHDGTVLWSKSRVTGDTIGPPTVADFDGDGEPEIGVAGHDVYVVIETNGSVKWSRSTNDYSSGFTGSAVFDFEGDGKAEVVYADENDVFVYDGATGAIKMTESRHSSATCSEYPSIADVDNDGHADIIYSSGAYSGRETGVSVIKDADDSWMPARAVWNQHGYAITNVNDDGSIPATPAVNWDTYNNFRSGDLSAATGGAQTDAVPVLHEVCNDECDADKLRVTVSVGNQGLVDMPVGVPISLWSKNTWLATEYTTEEIAPGETSEGMVFSLDPDDVGSSIVVRADDDNGTTLLSECDEDNNEIEIEKGLCK